MHRAVNAISDSTESPAAAWSVSDRFVEVVAFVLPLGEVSNSAASLA